jgi:hypothetical protein
MGLRRRRVACHRSPASNFQNPQLSPRVQESDEPYENGTWCQWDQSHVAPQRERVHRVSEAAQAFRHVHAEILDQHYHEPASKEP